MERNRRKFQELAKICAVAAVRNTSLEDIHAGRSPGSAKDDFSDVSVISPAEEISWDDTSRISQEEMKTLMKEVVNRLYTILVTLDEEGDSQAFRDFVDQSLKATAHWDVPELVKGVIPTIDFRTGKKYE